MSRACTSPMDNDDSERLDKLDALVQAHDRAIVAACGPDGKNGRLSYVAQAVNNCQAELGRLRHTLAFGLAVTLTFGASVYHGCVTRAEFDARHEQRLDAFDEWRKDHAHGPGVPCFRNGNTAQETPVI